MSDEKKYTEREMVMARRAAYAAALSPHRFAAQNNVTGLLQQLLGTAQGAGIGGQVSQLLTQFLSQQGQGGGVDGIIEARYPLPKATRQREVTAAAGWLYRINAVTGELECQNTLSGAAGRGWRSAILPIGAYVAIASLATNPTEEVDA